MEYPTLALSESKPRDLAQLRKKLPLHKGLAAFYFFGIFALLAPFAPVMSIALAGNIKAMGWVPLIFFFLVCEIIAFLMLFHANKTYQRRLRALSQGSLVKGKVTHHGRNFVFWKSARNYTITISFECGGKKHYHTVQSHRSDLHFDFPIGTELWGLYDSEGLGNCFPLEFGILLEAPKLPQKPLERK